MFKKLAFVCATLALTSAQNLQDLASQAGVALPAANINVQDLTNQAGAALPGQNLQSLASQANAALAPLLGQDNPVVQHGNSLSLNVNNYEWTLTEVNGEYDLNVEELADNANNLAPALSALLANFGGVAQANDNVIANALSNEAADVGVSIENGAGAANQAGSQLANNNAAIANLAQEQYSNVAAALANNQNGLSDQVNSQLNDAVQNQGALSNNVNNGVNAAVDNAGAAANLASSQAGNLPVDVSVTDANSVNNALNSASNVNVNDVAAAANNLANQGLDAAAGAANNNLGSAAASSAQGAANNAANSAATSLSSAASTLNANGVNNLNSAAAAVNPNQ